MIKSVPEDIQGDASRRPLSIALFSSGFKWLQQWDPHQSKRPVGALPQPKSLHFRENILILSLVIAPASPSRACFSAIKPFSPSRCQDVTISFLISHSVLPLHPFFLSFIYFFFFILRFLCFICFSGSYHHSNGRL